MLTVHNLANCHLGHFLPATSFIPKAFLGDLPGTGTAEPVPKKTTLSMRAMLRLHARPAAAPGHTMGLEEVATFLYGKLWRFIYVHLFRFNVISI
jgi:hypothetical protein